MNKRVVVFEAEEMTDMGQIAKSFVAKAEEVEGGFYAVFAAPGLLPRYVARAMTPDRPILFDTSEQAEDAARKALFGIMSRPREKQRRGKNERYEKVSGPDFAVLLAESGITLSLFSYIYGTRMDRAQGWIDGADNAPHPARVLLEIFKRHPETIDTAEEITNSVTTPRSKLHDA